MEGVEANGHSHWPDSLSVRANTEGWNAACPTSIVIGSRLAPSVKRGYMEPMQPVGEMPELLKRQIDRLETAIDLSTDWLEIQYLMVELDQLKALYEAESEAA